MQGYLNLDGWAGRTQQMVMVVRIGPKRTLIRAIERTKLAGRNRWLEPGNEEFVLSSAITYSKITPKSA